jgi:hypothetical protein
MIWALWIAGGLAALAALSAVAGAVLPRKHSATRKARYRVSREALYAVIAGPPDWRTGVANFGVLPEKDGRKRWWEEDEHQQKVTFELVEEQFPSRLAVRIADDGLPFGGTWSFEIEPVAGGGSELRIREDGEIRNVIFRLLAHYLFGYAVSIETYLRDLGAKFGQAVQIEA